MSDKNPIRTQVVSGLILAAVVSLLSLIPGGWAFAWAMVCEMWKMCAAWLHGGHMIGGWLLGLLLVCALFTVVVLVVFAVAWVTSSAASPVGWKSYQLDQFDGLKWRWRYLSDGSISNISCHCPHCDQQLSPQERSSYRALHGQGMRFHCDNCHQDLGEFDMSYDALEDKTCRSIQRKLRSGEWSHAVGKTTA